MSLEDEIMQSLYDFADMEYDTLKETLDQVGKETVKQLKATSPRGRSGRYAKGWRVKKVKQEGRRYEVIVHNKTDYQLTHLLENGHVKVLWGKRTGGFVKAEPHIKKAEEVAISNIERELKIRL